MVDTVPIPPPKAVAAAPAPDASRIMTLFVMIVATLYFGKEVLVPVVLALLLTFIIAPLVELLRRIHLGRVPSVLLGVALALGIVLAIGGVIGTQVASLSTDIPRYVGTVEAKIETAKQFTVGRLSRMAEGIGVQRAPASSERVVPATPAAPGQVSLGQAQSPAPATAAETNPLKLAETYLTPILSPLETFGIVFVVTVFALLQREDLRDRLIRLVGSDDLHRTTIAIDDGGRRLSRYFVTQLMVNSAFGVVIGIGLLVIGVPNPVLWGILSALLRFVPYVGAFISAVLPMALAAAVEPGWSMVLWTLALYVVAEGLTGQVIEPLLYGHSTGLSPFSVVVAAIFWSWLWGPVGLILSTPLTLCLVVMGRHVKRLEFLDVMLGDRPALTPVESFYQRMLAGDADEAQDHAEVILKQRSLSTYYDEVALKGLQLAANDAKRGALDHEQLNRVKSTIKLLVKGLAGHEDANPSHDEEKGAVEPPDDEQVLPLTPVPDTLVTPPPSPWSMPGAVLCIAGRGPLDEAASAMLAQLLNKHGLGGKLIGYEDVGRDKVEHLDITGVKMACISYLDISGTPAHLRYLVRRLHQRLPFGTPVLVGLWPSEDPALKDKAVQTTVGADLFTSTIADTVEACVHAAQDQQQARPNTESEDQRN